MDVNIYRFKDMNHYIKILLKRMYDGNVIQTARGNLK